MPSLEDILANFYSQPLPLCSHSILKTLIQDSEWLFCQLWHLSTTEVVKCCTEINLWTRNRQVEVQPNKRWVKNRKWSILKGLHGTHFLLKRYKTITTLFKNVIIIFSVFKKWFLSHLISGFCKLDIQFQIIYFGILN